MQDSERPRGTDYRSSSLLLTLLYVIQAIPLGLSCQCTTPQHFHHSGNVLLSRLRVLMLLIDLPTTIPNLSFSVACYAGVAFFAMSGYPYSLKLLWSPIVDSVYFQKFGRRKSWIVPVQLLSGCVMLMVSYSIEEYLNAETVPIGTLTLIFTTFTFLSATQDIAVDGWGLEMFPLEDRHTAAACQTIGLRIGFFISYTLFLFLNSAQFCNTYLRSTPQETGILTISDYIFMSGLIYVLISVLLIFKHEKIQPLNIDFNDDNEALTPAAVYRRIWGLLKLPNMRKLIFVLLGNRVGLITFHLFTLHLASKLPQHVFAEISVISFFVEMAVMWYTNKIIQHNPLSSYLTGYVISLGWGVLALIIAFVVTPNVGTEMSSNAIFLVAFLLLVFRILGMVMFLCLISDSSIGGTYLTLMNTVTNLGGTWPQTIIPAAVDWVTSSRCIALTGSVISQSCARAVGECTALGGSCSILFDGLYLVCAICIMVGVASVLYMKKTLVPLQNTHISHWRDLQNPDLEYGMKKDENDKGKKFC